MCETLVGKGIFEGHMAGEEVWSFKAQEKRHCLSHGITPGFRGVLQNDPERKCSVYWWLINP